MRSTVIIAALFLVAAPLVAADEDNGDPPDAANYGLCTADENNDTGDENSNGTVSETPPFSSLDEEDCEDAEPPSGPEDTPGDGADENGDDAGGNGSDAGSDNQPDDAGSQGSQAQSPSLPSHAAVALP